MIKLVVSACAAAVSLMATADPVLYKWVGASDASWQALESYTVDDGSGKHVTPTVLPGPLDTVAIIGTASVTNTVVVPDADLEFVAGLGRIGMNAYAKFVLNVQTDSVFRVAINGGTGAAKGSWNRDGWFIKKGPGELILSSSGRYSPDYRLGDYLCYRITVEEGAVRLIPEGPHGQTGAYVPRVEVWKDAEFQTYGAPITKITLDGLFGAGTVLCESSKKVEFNLNDSSTSEFSGRLVGNLQLHIRPKSVTVNLAGVSNEFAQVYVNTDADGEDSPRTWSEVGFAGGSTERTSPDSFGTNGTISIRTGLARFKYLGGAGGVCAKNFNFYELDTGITTYLGIMDGGSVGGLTLSTKSKINRGNCFNRAPMRFVFTGENPLECVYAGEFGENDDGGQTWREDRTCPVALVKQGSGIWHFTDNANRKNTGVIAVDEGTLRFDSIAPVKTVCSLGSAYHRYDPELTVTYSTTGHPHDADFVPYDIRLGHNGTRGTLEYCGTKAVDATASNSRVIAVDGEGALVNATDNAFKWANVITVTNEGPHTLVLGGDMEAVNVISNLCPAAGRTLSVAKEGLGTWTLEGTLTNVGAVAVDKGVLKVDNSMLFKYFRMTVTENMAKYGYQKPGWSNDVYFGQFALYDAEGVRHGCGLKEVSSSTALTPGTVRIRQGRVDTTLAKMFDPALDMETLDAAKEPFCTRIKSSAKLIEPENEASWVSFEMHLEDDAPEIAAMDYIYMASYYGTYYFSVPRAFVFEGSLDGRTWTELYATNNLPTYYDYSKRWASDPKNERGDVAAPRPGKGFRFTRRAVATHGHYPTALVGAGPISVAGGAKLTYEGDVAPIAALSVDLSSGTGDGTIAGARISEDGVLTVTGDVSGLSEIELPLAFEDVEGAVNIANWEVVVNGKSGRWDAVFSNGRLTIHRKGLVLIVR